MSGTGYGDGALTRLLVQCAPLRVIYDGGWQVELGASHSLTSPIASLTEDQFSGPCPAGDIAIGQYGGYNEQFVQDVTGGVGVMCATPSVVVQ